MTNAMDRMQANYDKLDMMADMIEPLGAIIGDGAVMEAWRQKQWSVAMSIMLRNHKSEVVALLAALDGVPVEEYEVKPEEVALKGIARLSELTGLVKAIFPTRAQSGADASSGHAMENIGDGAE